MMKPETAFQSRRNCNGMAPFHPMISHFPIMRIAKMGKTGCFQRLCPTSGCCRCVTTRESEFFLFSRNPNHCLPHLKRPSLSKIGCCWERLAAAQNESAASKKKAYQLGHPSWCSNTETGFQRNQCLIPKTLRIPHESVMTTHEMHSIHSASVGVLENWKRKVLPFKTAFFPVKFPQN